MTIVVKNTNISELLKVSNGDIAVLEQKTEEYRQLVQAPFKKASAATAGQSTARTAQSAGKP